MKKKHFFLRTATTLLLSVFLFTGCNREPEEVIPTFYNDGTYAPEDGTYSIELPSERWKIADEENPEHIIFVLNQNEISVQRTKNTDEKYQDKLSEIPFVQEELEEYLKENNIKQYTMNSFKSNIYYDETYKYETIHYIYANNDGTYKIFYVVIDDEYLYEMHGTTSNEDIMNQIKTSFDNFLLYKNQEEIKVFKIKEKKFEGNTYNSKNNDYILTLPYGNWNFEVSEDYSSNSATTITTDGIKISIQKQSKNNLSNTLVYEIPKTIDILNKQIEIKNLGEYEILDFKVKTVGTLPDYDETQDFITFSYLLKCNNNNEIKYYAYTEYRTENTTYQIEGILGIDDLEKANELNHILKSFYPTSIY